MCWRRPGNREPSTDLSRSLPGERAFLPNVRDECVMLIQPFIGGALLVLGFGLGVWVALQYVPMHLH
jgi:hypothetical protein